MCEYRLAIVDDEPSIRRGLSLMPWKELGFAVAGLFSDGRDVIEYMRANELDVVLTDVRMTHISGIELAKWISENRPEIMVVMLSGYSEFTYAQAAIAYNVTRYLLKPTNHDELFDVFRSIHGRLDRVGRSAVNDSPNESSQASWLSDVQDDSLLSRVQALLTEPEYLGARQVDIARKLGISSEYLSRLFHEKTGERFSDFVIRQRLAHAQTLLTRSAMQIQEIGHRVGYSDIRYFIRLFRNQYGMSPGEYRRRRLWKE